MKPYLSPGPCGIATCVAVGGVIFSSSAAPVTRLALLLAAFLLALAFVYIAARNVRVLGVARPRFSPGAAVAWTAIPGANVVMAHQVLTALWRESQPAPDSDRKRSIDCSVWLVNAWWLLLVGVKVLGTVARDFAAGRYQTAMPSDVPAMAQSLMYLAAGICFVGIVRGISLRQSDLWADLVQRQAVPQPNADSLR